MQLSPPLMMMMKKKQRNIAPAMIANNLLTQSRSYPVGERGRNK
tara:strand:+ start:97 stop:228 length:132 start_codon:yes stop_codon:yes gene_type:complete